MNLLYPKVCSSMLVPLANPFVSGKILTKFIISTIVVSLCWYVVGKLTFLLYDVLKPFQQVEKVLPCHFGIVHFLSVFQLAVESIAEIVILTVIVFISMLLPVVVDCQTLCCEASERLKTSACLSFYLTTILASIILLPLV